jgi:hypothetical protein
VSRSASRTSPAACGWRAWAGAVALGLALGACTPDRATTPTEATSPATPDQSLGSTDGGVLGTGLGPKLLRCRPLPAAHASAVIGRGGGTLSVGPHTLVVPPGALSSSLTITGDVPSDTVNSIRFRPQGLQFVSGHPAQLTMRYANCPLLGRLLPKRIAYTTDLLRILEILLSVDNVGLQKVSAQITHFSRYAISW